MRKLDMTQDKPNNVEYDKEPNNFLRVQNPLPFEKILNMEEKDKKSMNEWRHERSNDWFHSVPRTKTRI